MRERFGAVGAALLLASALAMPLSAAPEVTVMRDDKAFQARTPRYDAKVTAEGCLGSLRVGGEEFLSAPRGAYFYQGGILQLPTVEQAGADVITAKSEKASLRYEFGAGTLTCVAANTTDKPMEFVMVFDPAVSAVLGENGVFAKAPVTCAWKTSTWFRGKARLRIAESTRLWGPFAGNRQVWTVTIPANETRKVTLDAGTATDAELAAVAQAGPLAPPAKAPVAAPTEKVLKVSRPKYQATVGADGCLTSVQVDGQEFFKSTSNFPRGGYLYQGGLLPMPTVEQPSDDVITAKSEKANVRYEFGADTVTWTITNTSAKDVLALIVFDPGVNVVMDDKGWSAKTPTNYPVANTTWFRGKSNLRVAGGKRIWGPWSGNHQVWETTVAPNAAHKVTLQVNAASDTEIARATQVATAPPPAPPTEPNGPMWNMAALSKAPKTYPAEGFTAEGVRAVFFEGPPYQGRPTRVFAWIGMPKVEPGRKVPAMVLVHGGGGTAFDSWVRRWTARGYAAIAMDTCGCVPGGTHSNRPRHEFGGPPGWGGWGQIDWPREDQWTYHAVADAILAHSLLRSLPEVDADRVGLTGISWGGYLTCIIASVDPRFKFAVPVYGCGFTNEHAFAGSVTVQGKERGDRWMRWWDPSSYLKDAALPMLWVTGSNDFAYTLNALQKSYRLPSGPRTLAIRLRMPHGHGDAGEGPKEIFTFADSILKGGDPLPRITGQGAEGSQVWATFQSKVPVVKAELNITKDTGKWQDRKWDALPARIDGGKVTASLPEGVKVYYLNLYDERDCVVSTEHVEVGP